MANAAQATSLDMCAMRVSRLLTTGERFRDDGAGGVAAGTGAAYATADVVGLDFSFNIEEGEERTVKNACGDICAFYSTCDNLKNIEIDIELCKLDPELLNLLTGHSLINSAGTNIGMDIGGGTVPNCDSGVALELWSKAMNGSELAADPYTYIRWVFPRVRLQFNSDFSLGEGFATLSLSGDTQTNSNIGPGPWEDWPKTPTGHMMWFYDSAANYNAVVASITSGAFDIPA